MEINKIKSLFPRSLHASREKQIIKELIVISYNEMSYEERKVMIC